MTILGVDISAWQPTTPSLTGLEFAFARATYGIYRDVRYTQHTDNFRKAGLVTGAYHFGRAVDSIAGQVSAFLAVAGGADLLALDLERDGANASMTQTQAAQFIRSIQNRGRRIGLYHSDSGFPNVGQDFDWVAKWSSVPPLRDWEFWQYQGTTLDRNQYKGTLTQLRSLARIDAPSVASIRVAPGTVFYAYDIRFGPPRRIVSRHSLATANGFSASCSLDSLWVVGDDAQPQPPDPRALHPGARYRLVKLTSGSRVGTWIGINRAGISYRESA